MTREEALRRIPLKEAHIKMLREYIANDKPGAENARSALRTHQLELVRLRHIALGKQAPIALQPSVMRTRAAVFQAGDTVQVNTAEGWRNATVESVMEHHVYTRELFVPKGFKTPQCLWPISEVRRG